MKNYIKKLGIELMYALIVMVLFTVSKNTIGFEYTTMISIATIISKLIYSEVKENK